MFSKKKILLNLGQNILNKATSKYTDTHCMTAPASKILMEHKPGSHYRVREIRDLTPCAAYSAVSKGAVFSSKGRLGA